MDRMTGRMDRDGLEGFAPDAATPPPMRFRILLAANQEIWLDMLRTLLEGEFDIVGAAADTESLIESARRAKPDVALIDGAMASPGDFALGRRLIAAAPSIKIVYLTGKPRIAAEPAAGWASPGLLSATSVADLLQTIRGLAEREGRGQPTETHDIQSIEILSPRQREVLALLVRGLSMKSVARQLDITQRTVAFHKYRAMEALGLRGNAELVRFAVRHGLLTDGGTG